LNFGNHPNLGSDLGIFERIFCHSGIAEIRHILVITDDNSVKEIVDKFLWICSSGGISH